eukprot:4240809-Pleurochrysis_carterae.AAC.1
MNAGKYSIENPVYASQTFRVRSQSVCAAGDTAAAAGHVVGVGACARSLPCRLVGNDEQVYLVIIIANFVNRKKHVEQFKGESNST